MTQEEISKLEEMTKIELLTAVAKGNIDLIKSQITNTEHLIESVDNLIKSARIIKYTNVVLWVLLALSIAYNLSAGGAA